jgi:hypothetical protein
VSEPLAKPLPFRWTGDSFEPMPRFAKECDRVFVVGEVYTLTEVADRNMGAHRAYFASINEAWKNLPDQWGDYFRSPDHLRKWLLIQAGYCDQATFSFATPGEAQRFAAFYRKPTESSEFRVIDVVDNSITVYTAMSQQVLRKGKGMDAATFKASARAVTEKLDLMLGTPRGTVARQRASA